MKTAIRILGWVGGVLLVLAIAAFLALGVPDTDAAAMRAKYGRPPSIFIDLDGQAVHVRDTGPRDAPTLILVHGSNAFLQTWDGWADRLDGRWRVVRLDLPGHGLTGASPTRAYRVQDFAALVERLRARLGVDHIAIGGNSMGGGVALAYTLAYPEHVDALILVDSIGQPSRGRGDAPLAFRIARVPVVRDIAAQVTPRSLIARSLPGVFGDPRLATPEMIDRYWELLRYPGNRRATIDRFSSPPFALTTEDLAQVRAPTLVIWGEQDRLIPVESGRWLAARLRRARMVIYPQTGHLPQEERAAESAAELARFLSAAQQGERLRAGSVRGRP
ncbi:MAG TPA: alpha/beta hydrolase [Lautropia sp.]|nr:alpha/beta hydrolase [Lautropia sp.]